MLKCVCALQRPRACQECRLLAESEEWYSNIDTGDREPYYGDSETEILDQMRRDSLEAMSGDLEHY